MHHVLVLLNANAGTLLDRNAEEVRDLVEQGLGDGELQVEVRLLRGKNLVRAIREIRTRAARHRHRRRRRRQRQPGGEEPRRLGQGAGHIAARHAEPARARHRHADRSSRSARRARPRRGARGRFRHAERAPLPHHLRHGLLQPDGARPRDGAAMEALAFPRGDHRRHARAAPHRPLRSRGDGRRHAAQLPRLRRPRLGQPLQRPRLAARASRRGCAGAAHRRGPRRPRLARRPAPTWSPTPGAAIPASSA